MTAAMRSRLTAHASRFTPHAFAEASACGRDLRSFRLLLLLMKIISYNVNGLRAAIRKGFIEWLQTHPADVICIQENKAQQSDVDIKAITELGYEDHWFCAQKKGYSGVTVFSKIKPDHVQCGTGHQVSDDEGRVIQLDFGKLRVINAYFPSGTSGDARQEYKYQWLEEFYDYVQALRQTQPNLLVCGDYNIAHREIDIHDPKGNKKNSGFLPEERAWMDKFYGNGWVDTLRVFNEDAHHYSWWSQRSPTVRAQNKGWRIDYISVTEPLKPALRGASIFPDVQHSDHCPIYAELDVNAIQ
jgi:exodeoxyribonuclease-3